jgi:hypothetical protein
VIGVVIGTGLLTGCSEKQQANDTLPSRSAAPTTEVLLEAGPADFPVPDEARTKDAEGAEAFLRYFIDLLNRQRAIPDGQPLRDLGPECQECLRIAKVYDDAAAADRQFEGGELVLESVATATLEGDAAIINFLARQDTLSLIDAAGTVLDSLPADSGLGSGIGLVWSETDNSWLITALDIG